MIATKRLFVTIGTSIFTNMLEWARDTKHPQVSNITAYWESIEAGRGNLDQENWLMQVANDEFLAQGYKKKVSRKLRGPGGGEETAEEWRRLESPAENEFSNNHASAEIQSIRALLEEPDWQDDIFELHLVTTQTKVSAMAANLIKTYFQNIGRIHEILVKEIPGLQVTNEEAFVKTGFQELVGYLFNPKGEKPGTKPFPGILNVTGGYKGIVPVLAIAGQLLEMPIYYLYENSEMPIRIEPLPLTFDWTFMEVYRHYFMNSERPQLLGSDNSRRVMSSDVLSTAEEKAFFEEKLVTNRMMEKLEGGDYAMTYLGYLVENHIEIKSPGSRNSFGLPIEFPFYEYLLSEPFVYMGKAYEWVVHNKKVENKDFDLFLYPSRNDKTSVVVGEVTSFGQMFMKNGKYTFKRQLIEKQLPLFEQRIVCPEAYLLFLYGFKPMNNWEGLRPSVEDMWGRLRSAGVGAFKVFVVDLPVSVHVNSNNPNWYTSLYQKKLTSSTETFDANIGAKYGNPYLLVSEKYSFSNNH